MTREPKQFSTAWQRVEHLIAEIDIMLDAGDYIDKSAYGNLQFEMCPDVTCKLTRSEQLRVGESFKQVGWDGCAVNHKYSHRAGHVYSVILFKRGGHVV